MTYRLIEVTRRGQKGDPGDSGISSVTQHSATATNLTYANRGHLVRAISATNGDVNLPAIDTIGAGWHVIINMSPATTSPMSVVAPAGGTIEGAATYEMEERSTAIFVFDGSTKFYVIPLSNTLRSYWDASASAGLTIAAGSITPTSAFHIVDTEGAAAADDLDTVTTSGIPDGFRLTLCCANAARVVTVKTGTGNIYCNTDRALDNTHDAITLLKVGSEWRMVGFQSNA